jgi:hypothetical protein
MIENKIKEGAQRIPGNAHAQIISMVADALQETQRPR